MMAAGTILTDHLIVKIPSKLAVLFYLFAVILFVAGFILLQIKGGLVVLILAAVTGTVGWLIIRIFAKWRHLLYMIGIMIDGALLSVSGSVMVGLCTGNGRPDAAIILAILCFPALVWTGLYRECWRQKIAFPGIRAW